MHALPRIMAALATLPLLVTLAACSDSGKEPDVASISSPSAGGSASAAANPEEQERKFIQCMRDNGVNLEDPSADGGPVGMSEYGDEATVTKAMKACGHLTQQSSQDPGRQAATQEQLLKYTQCMRKNGADIADPSADGGLGITLPDTPEAQKKFEEANKVCAAALTGEGSGK